MRIVAKSASLVRQKMFHLTRVTIGRGGQDGKWSHLPPGFFMPSLSSSCYNHHKTKLALFATILTKPLCGSRYNPHKTNMALFATILTKPLCGSRYIATQVSGYSVGPGQPLQATLKFYEHSNFFWGDFLIYKATKKFSNTSVFLSCIFSY